MRNDLITNYSIYVTNAPPNEKEHRKVFFFALWDSNGSSVNDLPAAGHSATLPEPADEKRPLSFRKKNAARRVRFFCCFLPLELCENTLTANTENAIMKNEKNGRCRGVGIRCRTVGKLRIPKENIMKTEMYMLTETL